ncbi:F-box domain-containing protein [Colletotrichum somersetense]|nr:F-box domain-containing protein [Colletotrichum somersetense]
MAPDWLSLPLEIRLLVLDDIKSLCQSNATDIPRYQLPLVCREWHSLFVHENFRLLVLDQDRLDDFEKHVVNNETRREYVQRIVLRIRLPDYDCPACEEAEDEATALANDELFINVVGRFTTIMSAWPKRDHNPGITLDLGVYSPSDGRHGFRDYRFSDQYRYGASQTSHQQHADALCRDREAGGNQKSTCPGWNRICNVQCSSPSLSSKERLLAITGDHRRPQFAKMFTDGRISRNSYTTPSPTLKGIASAPVITSLVLPRHYYRSISLQVLDCLVRQGFPNLESFRRESWRADDVSLMGSMEGCRGLFTALPPTTDHFSLLCESNDVLQKKQDADTVAGPSSSSTRPAATTTHSRMYPSHCFGPYMGVAATRAATRLRSFCATYTIAFEDFIKGDHRRGHPIYHRLENLVMTSDWLQKRVSLKDPEFLTLISSAARLAFTSMPNLKNLVVWDGDESDGFLMRFTYTYHTLSGTNTQRRQPTVFCRGNRYPREDITKLFTNLRLVIEWKWPSETRLENVLIHLNTGNTGGEEGGEGERGPAVTRRLPEELEFHEVRDLILDPESARQRLLERRVS